MFWWATHDGYSDSKSCTDTFSWRPGFKDGELKTFYTRNDVVGVFPRIMRRLKERRKRSKREMARCDAELLRSDVVDGTTTATPLTAVRLDAAVKRAIARHWPGGDMNLEYEKFVPLLVVFTMKRYTMVGEDGVYRSKGLKAVRGDSIALLRGIERDAIRFVVENRQANLQKALCEYGRALIDGLAERPLDDFVKTAKVKDSSEYKCPERQAGVRAVCQKIRAGLAHSPNDRISWIIVRDVTTATDDGGGGSGVKASETTTAAARAKQRLPPRERNAPAVVPGTSTCDSWRATIRICGDPPDVFPRN